MGVVMKTFRIAALAVLVASTGTACAHAFGKRASAGALEGISSDDPNKQPSRVAAKRAVESAIEALDAPENRRRLLALSAAIASEAARGALAAFDEEQERR